MLYKLHLRTFSLFCFALPLIPVSTWAQVDKGSLLGTVADSSQAALPRVAIRAIDMGTGVSHANATNEASNYSFPLLDPGVYRVEAER
jgi:hypothetical protein